MIKFGLLYRDYIAPSCGDAESETPSLRGTRSIDLSVDRDIDASHDRALDRLAEVGY